MEKDENKVTNEGWNPRPAEGGIEVRGAYKPKPTEIGKRPAPTPSSPPKKESK